MRGILAQKKLAQNCAESSRFLAQRLYESMTYEWVVAAYTELGIFNP